MNTKNKNLTHVIKLCECAILIALAIVLDILSKLIFGPLEAIWQFSGGITLCMIPVIFISYRHGFVWGILSAFVYSGIQMMMGWSVPNGLGAFILCILLDYVLAYTVLGSADLFAKLFKNKLFGYGFGAFIVCMLRFICSFISGAILWGSYMPKSFNNIWVYSLVYNGSYMLPSAIITTVVIVAICAVFNPKTLKRYPKTEENN